LWIAVGTMVLTSAAMLCMPVVWTIRASSAQPAAT
jgi:hypothetical protein